MNEISSGVAALLGAFIGGFFSVLGGLLTNFLAIRREQSLRKYNEKKEAYIGLLNAIHEAAVRPTDAASKNFALWQTRVELVGSRTVCRFAGRLPETNDNRIERDVAFKGLRDAMRSDLKIDVEQI